MGTFELTAKVAIEELILKNSSKSKFGLFLSNDQIEMLKEDFLNLLVTSRNLRVAGEKFLNQSSAMPKPQGSVSKIPFRVTE